MTLQIDIALSLLLLLFVANGGPVMAKWLLGDRLAFPLDGGLRFFDGGPLLGPSKTVRGLLVGVVAALIKGDSPRLLGWGLTIACFYLTFAVAAQNTVNARIAPSLASLGLDEAPRLVQPTPFNTLLWRVTVVEDGTYYEGVVSLFDGQTPLALTQLPRGAEWEDAALAMAAAAFPAPTTTVLPAGGEGK